MVKILYNICSYPTLISTMQIGHFEISTNTNCGKRIRYFRCLGILHIIDIIPIFCYY